MTPALGQLTAELIWVFAAAAQLDDRERERFVDVAADAVARLALLDFEDDWLEGTGDGG